jgi:ligand-binding sensor domain-containing protein
MMLKKIILISLIPLINISVAGAEAWFSYTNSNEVRQIASDSDLIWGATSGGVISYSTANGETFKLTNTDGLGGIDYYCVEVDTAGFIWLGSSDGWLDRISDTGEIVNYPVVEHQGFFDRRVAVYDLSADGEVLWMANDMGVSKFLIYSNGGEIKDTARRLGGLEDEEDIKTIAIIGDNVWAGSDRGVAFTARDNPNIQDPNSWRSFEAADFPLGRAKINSIAAYYDTVVVGADSGLFKLTTSPDTAWIEMGSFSSLRVRKVVFRLGNLYVSTNAGVRVFDGATWSNLSNEGLPPGGTGDLTFDNNDRLWAATSSSGLAEYDGSIWILHSIPGPASNVIINLAIDSTGALWIAHDGKGLSKFIDGEWNIYNSANSGLDNNGAHSLVVAGNGDLWIGSWGSGLFRFDGTSWQHWNSNNCPMFGVPTAHEYWAASEVEIDRYGNVWVSSLDADSGLVMGTFDPVDSIWHRYFEGPNTISENTVEAFLPQGNTMWIGTTVGLHRLDFGGTPFNQSDDSWLNYLIRDFVSDLALDPFGNLWVGTPSGLYYVETGSNAVRQVEMPLEISGSVRSVASDGLGNIWVGTVTGVGILRPVPRPDIVSWKVTYNTQNSPLLNNEVSDIAIDISSGMVYLGTYGGLSIFDSGVEPPSEDLSDVEAFPNPVLVAQGDNSISFKRVPTEAIVSIYTVSGDLIKSFKLSEETEWNLRNSNGEPVAGGIYFFVVEYQGKSGTGKFAIIK